MHNKSSVCDTFVCSGLSKCEHSGFDFSWVNMILPTGLFTPEQINYSYLKTAQTGRWDAGLNTVYESQGGREENGFYIHYFLDPFFLSFKQWLLLAVSYLWFVSCLSSLFLLTPRRWSVMVRLLFPPSGFVFYWIIAWLFSISLDVWKMNRSDISTEVI